MSDSINNVLLKRAKSNLEKARSTVVVINTLCDFPNMALDLLLEDGSIDEEWISNIINIDISDTDLDLYQLVDIISDLMHTYKDNMENLVTNLEMLSAGED